MAVFTEYSFGSPVVAFISSLIISFLMTGAIFWYAKRRPVGTPLTWGEAMLASAYVFFLVFVIYGVVPHQWLTWAENEQGWRPDRLFFGWGDIVKPKSQGGWFPFDITYRAISDTVAVVIYGIFLSGQIWVWAKWQNRGDDSKAKAALVKKSTYGRPLVKQG